MIHLSLNLPSGTAARAAARRAKRLYPFAGSLLRGVGGGRRPGTRPPPTPPLLKDDSDNSGGGGGGVESPQPLRTIENVPGGPGRRAQGSPRCCSSHPFTRHQGNIPEVILGFRLAEPGSNRGRGPVHSGRNLTEK